MTPTTEAAVAFTCPVWEQFCIYKLLLVTYPKVAGFEFVRFSLKLQFTTEAVTFCSNPTNPTFVTLVADCWASRTVEFWSKKVDELEEPTTPSCIPEPNRIEPLKTQFVMFRTDCREVVPIIPDVLKTLTKVRAK